jgi:hypothetical protein
MSYYHHLFIVYVDAVVSSCDTLGLSNDESLKRSQCCWDLQQRIRKGGTIVRITVNPIGRIV